MFSVSKVGVDITTLTAVHYNDIQHQSPAYLCEVHSRRLSLHFVILLLCKLSQDLSASFWSVLEQYNPMT